MPCTLYLIAIALKPARYGIIVDLHPSPLPSSIRYCIIVALNPSPAPASAPFRYGIVDTLCSGKHQDDDDDLVLYGLYAPQLAWWLSLYSAQQLHVMSHEYLSEHQDEAMVRTFSFLGLTAVQLSEEVVKARVEEITFFNHEHEEGPLFDPDNYVPTMNRLYAFYEPANAQLYTLLGALGVKNFTEFPTSYITKRAS